MHAYSQLQNRLKEGYDNSQNGLGHAANVIIPGTPNTKRNQLSDKQKVQHYRDSVKGDPNVDASKIAARETANIPRVVAKQKPELDFFGPINNGIGLLTKTIETGVAYVGDKLLKRHINSEQQPQCINAHSVAWLQVTSYNYKLSVQLVGDISPASNCIGSVPIFIDGNPGQASRMLPTHRSYPNKFQVLDFTASEFVAEKCNTSDSMICIAPDTSGITINTQIDTLLEQSKDAYIYLTTEQMDNWLASKKASNEIDKLRYIRVSPKTDDGMQLTTLGGIITSSLLGTGLLAFGGIYMCRRLCGDKQSEITNSKETVATRIDATKSPDSSASSTSELSSVEV